MFVQDGLLETVFFLIDLVIRIYVLSSSGLKYFYSETF